MAEPNNKVSEEVMEKLKQRFFAIESTSKTSPIDIHEFCSLLNIIVKKYNLKWCQSFWNNEHMVRHGSKCLKCKTYNIIELKDEDSYYCQYCETRYNLVEKDEDEE